ncbi:hypothetical protein D3C78_1546190 [compost metagenome]
MRFRLGKADWRRQRRIATGAQRFGGSVQAGVQVIQLAGLHQAQVAAGQFDAAFAGQAAIPAQALGQAAFEQLRMTQAAYPIGQHAGERQIGLVPRQAQGQGTEGLGHGGAVDHRQHRHAEVARQVSA